MSEFINTIDQLGDDVTMAKIIERSITEFKDDVLTKIGQAAFYCCNELTNVELPNVTNVDDYSFTYCTNLINIKANSCEKVGSYAFDDCNNLNLPTFVENLTSVGVGAFRKCKQFTKINLPKVTTIGSQSFDQCISLVEIDTSVLTSLSNSLQGCSELKMLIMRNSTMATLRIVACLYNTPIASGTGYIYVPRALLSDDDSTKDYRRATNWSTYANQFRAIEDYTVDGTTTGELDSTKI